jgi:uncharacterized protein YbjT (DUF2867 family)
MVCPKWIDTRIQPIALRDVLAYLVGVLLNPQTACQTYDIGGDEILTYRDMMQQYAEARGIPRRIIFRVPFLTPLLSAYWVDLVTPVPWGRPSFDRRAKERGDMQDDRIDEYVLIERPLQRCKNRLFRRKDGPGITGF